MQNWKKRAAWHKKRDCRTRKEKKGTLHVQLMIPFCRPHNNFVYQKENGIIANID